MVDDLRFRKEYGADRGIGETFVKRELRHAGVAGVDRWEEVRLSFSDARGTSDRIRMRS